MKATLNLVKLCVGAEGVEDLAAWQAARAAEARKAGRDPGPVHTTRMRPKRAEELLRGGSLYWVFRGLILARQRIVGLGETEGGDGPLRCVIRLDAEIVRVEPRPRAPFQGWRYLEGAEAPPDLGRGGAEGFAEEAALPLALQRALAEIGVRRRG